MRLSTLVKMGIRGASKPAVVCSVAYRPRGMASVPTARRALLSSIVGLVALGS